MAFDAGLAERVAALLPPDAVEKRMFGGVAWMVAGNLAVGIHGERLIVRVGADDHAAALARPHVHPFDLTGRPMKGWVTVAPEGVGEDGELAAWVAQGVAFARTL